MKLSIDSIIVADRMREDLGDIEGLAASINQHGLIQPIVLHEELTQSTSNDPVLAYRLVVGGRRLTALRLLGLLTLEQNIHFLLKHQLSPAAQAEIELEENIRRLSMNWKEQALGTKRIHEIKVNEAALAGKTWTASDTASLPAINVGRVQVGYKIRVANELEKGNEKVKAAASLTDAIKVILQQEEDLATAELAKRQFANRSPVSVSKVTPTIEDDPLATSDQFAHDEAVIAVGPDGKLVNTTVSQVQPTVNISSMLWRADCLDFLGDIPSGSLDAHIVSDPPYGIDMSNIQQQNGGMNVERTAEEHDVDSNLALLAEFIPRAYRVLADNRFMVLWCDAMHFRMLHDLGVKAGFKVQRWPLHWIKTHRCQNMAAQFNFTKATEVAIVMRKGSALLNLSMPTNYWQGSNTEIKEIFPNHPFVKPIGLWQWIIEAVSLENQVIFDPFMGVGSCALSTLQAKRRFLGCELTEHHHTEAIVAVTNHFKSVIPNVRFE